MSKRLLALCCKYTQMCIALWQLTRKEELVEDEGVHPVLGELVADLQYKRVYRTSIASLVKAPVWEKQRILRPERALAIAESKMRSKVRCNNPLIRRYSFNLNDHLLPTKARKHVNPTRNDIRQKQRQAEEYLVQNLVAPVQLLIVIEQIPIEVCRLYA